MAELIKTVRTTWENSGKTPRYRLWVACNPPGSMDFFSVENPEEAHRLIQIIQNVGMTGVPAHFNGVCGLEELANGEYYEWYSDIDAEDIQNTMEFIKQEVN